MAIAERPATPLDPQELPGRKGTAYPPHLATQIRDRVKRALGDPAGLTRFGVNLVELPAGEISSQRHWHTAQDEFVYLLEGELTLVTDAGESRFVAGQCIGFPAGRADGHQLQNRAAVPAVYLEIGDRTPGDRVIYPDVDMSGGSEDGVAYRFARKDGTNF